MTRRSIEEIKARADEFADAFENYDPKPGDQDAPLPSAVAVRLAAWRRGQQDVPKLGGSGTTEVLTQDK